MGTILLFYKYVDIEYPAALQKWQKKLCDDLQLTGRIIIAHEGINGTVGGTEQATQAYIDAMNTHPLFESIDFKTSPGGAQAFPKMKIVLRSEIVHLGVDTKQVTVKDTGKHLTPEQTHDLLSNPPENLILVDTRNNYESDVGTFQGATIPGTRYFREFPHYVDENLDQFKDKTVLMFCTGGVRCERASAYLNQKKVAQEVYQLSGGIHRYIEKFPDGFFRGKNYVFDQRITVAANKDVLAKCLTCKTSSDEYFNCSNALCNKHFTSCAPCIAQLSNACSTRCQQLLLSKSTPERIPLQKM